MKHTVEVMISEAEVAARIAKLGEEITARYRGSDEVVMIGLLRGSCVFWPTCAARPSCPSPWIL